MQETQTDTECPIVIAGQSSYHDLRDLVVALGCRQPTFWVNAYQAGSHWAASGQDGLATLWADIPCLSGEADPQLPFLRMPAVVAVVVNAVDIRWLFPHVRTVLEGKRCFLSDGAMTADAARARSTRGSRPHAFQSACQGAVHGVVVLPEDLHIIRSDRLWPNRQVVVLPDTFSSTPRNGNNIQAMARLVASYLEIGATQVVVSPDLFCEQPNPLRAYDDLLGLIARERQAKTA